MESSKYSFMNNNQEIVEIIGTRLTDDSFDEMLTVNSLFLVY